MWSVIFLCYCQAQSWKPLETIGNGTGAQLSGGSEPMTLSTMGTPTSIRVRVRFCQRHVSCALIASWPRATFSLRPRVAGAGTQRHLVENQSVPQLDEPKYAALKCKYQANHHVNWCMYRWCFGQLPPGRFWPKLATCEPLGCVKSFFSPVAQPMKQIFAKCFTPLGLCHMAITCTILAKPFQPSYHYYCKASRVLILP